MKLFVCILLIFFETLLFAQEDPLPLLVNDNFIAKYQKACNISWYEDENTIFIDFELDHDFFKALYSRDGQWQETCRRIEKDSFPSKIVKVITSKYPSIQLINGDFVETPKGDKFYRFFGYVAETDYTINISQDGKILEPVN